jgi:MFS family permease
VLGVAGAIGSTVGGWVASHAGPLVIGSYHWSHYHWLLLLAILAHVPCLFLVRRLKEEGAGEPRVMAAWLLRRIMPRPFPG